MATQGIEEVTENAIRAVARDCGSLSMECSDVAGYVKGVGLRIGEHLKVLDQLRFFQSKAVQCLNKRHQRNFVCTVSFANLARTKKAASGIPDAAATNPLVNGLEREIHTCADHSKIIVWAVHEIPAEITDPADVRS